MKLLLLVVLLLTIVGCSSPPPESPPNNMSQGELTGDTPPNAQIEIDGVRYDTEQGSYCWTSRCVDMIGPSKMLADKTPLSVSPNTKITLLTEYDPQPNQVHVSYTTSTAETFEEIDVEGHTIQAPAEQGVYYFNYGVWWVDEARENVSRGSSFYYFVIEVS